MDASLLLADPLSENMAVFCSEDGGSNRTNPTPSHSTRPVSRDCVAGFLPLAKISNSSIVISEQSTGTKFGSLEVGHCAFHPVLLVFLSQPQDSRSRIQTTCPSQCYVPLP